MKDFLQHLFLPRPSNNHRAKALQVDAMFLYIAVFVFFNIAIRQIHNNFPDVLGYATNIQIDRLLTDTNQKRAEAGLQPLVLNQELSQAAAAKAANMFAENYWAHVAPDGKTPWDFILATGYKYTVAGENLAKNFQDSDGVVNAWMASPSHRENLLKSNYKEIGFAIVNGKLQGEDTTLVVQMFGTRPVGSVAEALPPSNPPPAPVVAAKIPPSTATVPQKSAVVIPQVASATTRQPSALEMIQMPFSSIIKTPVFDIVTVKNNVTLVFAGILLGIFVVDLYMAFKRKTVRAVGSSFAHMFFIAAMLISMNNVLHGAIL